MLVLLKEFKEIFGLVGITLILTSSYIFYPVRAKIEKINKTLGYLISCPQCMGFWIAVGFSLYEKNNIIDIILFGGFISLLGHSADSLISMINRAFIKD